MIPDHIKLADKELVKINKQLHFLEINPLNTDIIKNNFLKKKENIKFEYDISSKDKFLTLRKKAKALLFGNTPLDKIYKEKQEDTINKTLLFGSIGHKSFTKNSKRVWGKPNKKLLKLAYELIETKIEKEDPKISSRAATYKLKNAFKSYGIDKKWRLIRKDLTSSADVDPTNKILSLKKKEQFSSKFINRLIIHEIGTHVLRYENGVRQPLKIFAHGLAGYLKTEEGLAAYNEYKHHLMSNSTLKQYAGRVIAVNLGLKYPFEEVFKEMKTYFKQMSAFKLTLRAKRGIDDPNSKGGCTKDMVYLQGFNEVKNYIENEKGDYKDLYYGKIGINHIPIIKEIPELKAPKFLPHDPKQSTLINFKV